MDSPNHPLVLKVFTFFFHNTKLTVYKRDNFNYFNLKNVIILVGIHINVNHYDKVKITNIFLSKKMYSGGGARSEENLENRDRGLG